MNTKQMSKIRNKAKHIMVEWLKGLLNPDEQKLKLMLRMYLNYYLIKLIIGKELHYVYNLGLING